MKNLENTIRNLYKINQDIVIKEDGHVDVASSIRKCKTSMEDASQIMNKLKTMDPEGSLPTWWTNKLAVACMSLNKLRDYIVTSAESVTEKKHLDPVNPKAVKKKFADRKDKDIDNDGDVDSSDKYLHKRRKAVSKAIKGEAKKEKKDDVEINPKMDDMREKVQIPDKMKRKMDKIVKALKKSVGAHAKQAKTIGKMTSMDKPDDIQEKHGGDHVSTGRKMTDAEMKKREDIKKGLMKSKSDFKDRYGKDADQVMNALATKKAMEANEAMSRAQQAAIAISKKEKGEKPKEEDIIRRGDAKVVKVKGPDGKPMFKKMRPVVKVDDPSDHAMKAEEAINEAEMNYKVSIEGLPDFFVAAKNPGEVKIKMRKMLKKPDMLNMVKRVPDADMKKHFRLKAQGKDEDEQQPMKEETVMSEDNTNPLVKAVSDILSRNSFNSFRDVKPIDEKMSSKEKMAKGLYNQKGVSPAPKGMVDKAPGDQDAGAKAMQKDIMTKKMKDQDKKIPQGASTLHMCAKNVMHEKFGRGECLYGMHADPDENGHVSHYDIMFNHGIEKDMPISECEVLHERMHGHKMKKKEK